MPKTEIDWTKPIEYRSSGVAMTAAVVGRDGENYVVRIDGSSVQYYAYCPDGYNIARTFRAIYNVPPPKIEKTVVVLLFKDGSCLGVQRGTESSWNAGNIIARKTVTITEGEGL